MIDINDVKELLIEVLHMEGDAHFLDENTNLLGSIPEFDSMAVVSVITAIEENYGIVVDDDEVTAELFETVGTLYEFIQQKLGG